MQHLNQLGRPASRSAQHAIPAASCGRLPAGGMRDRDCENIVGSLVRDPESRFQIGAIKQRVVGCAEATSAACASGRLRQKGTDGTALPKGSGRAGKTAPISPWDQAEAR